MAEGHPVPARSRRKLVLRLAFGIIAGLTFALLTFALFELLGLKPGPISSIWVALALLAVDYYLSIALHELAHAATARVVGMRVHTLTIGPLRVSRAADGSVSVHWMWRFFLGGFTGAVFRDGRFRRGATAMMIAAGPLVSLLLAVGSLALLDLGPTPARWREISPWLGSARFFLLYLGYFSLFHFVFSAVPLPGDAGFCFNDGRQLVRLWSNSPEVVQWRALQAIGHLSLAGARPRVWPEELVRQLEAREGKDRTGAFSAAMSLQYAVDAGFSAEEVDRRYRLAASRLEALPLPLQEGIRITLAFHDAWIRKDAASARAWLAVPRSSLVDAFHRRKVDAALALLEGRLLEARQAVDETRVLMRRARFVVSGDEYEHLDAMAAAAGASGLALSGAGLGLKMQ
jgi:hypothetical protein